MISPSVIGNWAIVCQVINKFQKEMKRRVRNQLPYQHLELWHVLCLTSLTSQWFDTAALSTFILLSMVLQANELKGSHIGTLIVKKNWWDGTSTVQNSCFLQHSREHEKSHGRDTYKNILVLDSYLVTANPQSPGIKISAWTSLNINVPTIHLSAQYKINILFLKILIFLHTRIFLAFSTRR